ncbi:STAS domain-containing protein [Nonomuraea wenchangensis]|uniref:STAS domain-containing protein n=1 Tax=Nonomuraea wenchangensis TaxID=568860 RepID=UPI0033284CA2
MQLSVRLVPVGETTLVVALTGELDSTTRPVLAAFLEPLPQSRVKYVVIAAADLWFCDLDGLEQLALTHGAMRRKGGGLVVAEARPPLLRLISLMAGQAEPIPAYPSMPEALAQTDVDVYEVSGPPTPVPRHMPVLRNVRTTPLGEDTRDRPRPPRHPRPGEAPPGEARPGEARPGEARPGETPHDETLPDETLPALSLAVSRSRGLREQALRQRSTLTRQLLRTTQSRTLLLSARERCFASLEVLRTSRVSIRSAIDGQAAPPAPHVPGPHDGAHEDGVSGQERRHVDDRR